MVTRPDGFVAWCRETEQRYRSVGEHRVADWWQARAAYWGRPWWQRLFLRNPE